MSENVVEFEGKFQRRGARMEKDTPAGCPVTSVMHGISGKWIALVMMALSERPHRFGELRRLLPEASQRMLTQALRDLQRDGYVHREVLPTNPPSVEYSLNPLGISLFHHLQSLLRWSAANHEAVYEARRSFDAERG